LCWWNILWFEGSEWGIRACLRNVNALRENNERYLLVARNSDLLGSVLLMIESSGLKEALLHAIDDGLAVPGEIVRTAIYDRIERSYQLRREEIPDHLETFHKALQDLLGAGARVMEKLIAKSLYRRLKLNFTQHDGWTLIDYVNHAKEAKRNG